MAVIRPLGAYGLRIRGMEDGSLPVLPGASMWPEVELARQVADLHTSHQTEIGPDVAGVSLLRGDRAILRRKARTATLLTSAPDDDGRMLHPFLTTVAVVFACWDGRHAFHGGAFLDSGGRAWGLLGERGSGKSSTLAHLSLSGLTVIADDLLVLRNGNVFVGPRCVDLRPDSASALGVATEAVPVRAGDRLRLALQPAPVEVPLRGWVFLGWGDRTDLRRLGAGERLQRSVVYLSTPSEQSPSMLELVGLPAWELLRPAKWQSLEPTVERLLDLVGS